MKITIATLFDDRTADHWVGAFQGELPLERKRSIAHSFSAVLDGDPEAHQEEGRTMGFRLVELDSTELTNIWD